MILYCWQHNGIHHVTNGDAEQIIYALFGVYSDEVTESDADSRPYAGEAPWDHHLCPLTVLGWASDGEMYREHVEQGVECRRARARNALVSGATP